MIVLQHAHTPSHPEQSTIPESVSVAMRPARILPLSPTRLCETQHRPLGEDTFLAFTQKKELAKVLEQDRVLDDLCKPLSCKLCNVTLNSAQQARAHYQGKHHSRKIRNYCAENSSLVSSRLNHLVEPISPRAVPTSAVPGMAFSKPGGRVIMATENDYCKLCDAAFSSPVVAQAHYQGKNHTKRLRLADAQRNSFTDLSKRRFRKEGNEYKVVQSRRNTNAVHDDTGPYFKPCSRQLIPRDLAMCVTPSGQFYCSMCNAGATEEAEFRLHLESKPHKSKVSEQRYRNEMENLGYI